MIKRIIKYFNSDKILESNLTSKVNTFLFIGGLLFLTFLVNRFGFENILDNIIKTGWWLIPIIGVWALVYFLNAWAWKLVIKSFKHTVSFKDIFSISLSGFAINYITPIVNLGGEPYKVFMLSNQIGFNSSVSTVILYSMLHFLSSFVFWFFAIILAVNSLPLTIELQTILGIFFLFTIIGLCFFYSKHKNGIFKSLITLIRKLPFSKISTEKLQLTESNLKIIDSQIVELYIKQRKTFYTSLGIEVIARVVASIEFIFILKAIGMEISLDEAIYINAFSSLALNLFFFIPMGLGIREGSLLIIMGGINIASTTGIYIGLVNRVREFFWILVGLLLIQYNRTKNPQNKISY